MEIKDLNLSEERVKKLEEAIDKRFGAGYFGLNAGTHFEKSNDAKYEWKATFLNFNSVSGWATIGAVRWDEKKQRYIINFRGKGLGRTAKYS